MTVVSKEGVNLTYPAQTTRITCGRAGIFVAAGRDIDPAHPPDELEMPFVAHAENGVDLGVELGDRGRVIGVAAEAEAAGLKANDVVVAVDGVSVAGFDPKASEELGFFVPPGHVVLWTIERAGKRRMLAAVAPGAFAAPIYLDDRPRYRW
jgi:hypothetical protein